jgi:hypothetical protein
MLKFSKSGFIAMAIVCASPFMSVGQAKAACMGSDCNDKDPNQQGCTDGVVLEKSRQGFYSYGPWWNRITRERTIWHMYSKKCRANWTRADAPYGTTLFVQEFYAPGTTRGRYRTTTDGLSYSNMSTGNVPNRACATFPVETYAKCTTKFY